MARGWRGERWGGSGFLTVLPVERSDQCGSNGGGWRVVVAVLAEIRGVDDRSGFFNFFFDMVGMNGKGMAGWAMGWQWLGGSGTVG
jgi:hypothetical protein